MAKKILGIVSSKKKAATPAATTEQKGPIVAPLAAGSLSPELRRRLGKAQGGVGSTAPRATPGVGIAGINSTARLGA